MSIEPPPLKNRMSDRYNRFLNREFDYDAATLHTNKSVLEFFELLLEQKHCSGMHPVDVHLIKKIWYRHTEGLPDKYDHTKNVYEMLCVHRLVYEHRELFRLYLL